MDVPCEMLLHPELLSNEQLKHVIQQRQLKIQNLYSISRDELLDIFHQFCVPYGQRKYRDSGRGKMLNKTRQMSPEPISKLNVANFSQNRKEIYNYKLERVKPPPDLLSGHMKRIKLETTFMNKDFNSHKRKMSVDDVTMVAESTPVKKNRKPITWP